VIDVIVVGSGPGGVNAAAALVEAGRRVRMLDVGYTDDRYAPLIPAASFTDLRRTHEEQHRWFLGDDFEGVPFGPVRVGAQLTPPRQHIVAVDDPRLPVDSDGFAVVQSLAQGGLGAGWGAGVFPFSDDELGAMGLGLRHLQPHYDAVVARVGVSGALDDLTQFFPPSREMMPAADFDSNGESLLARYQRRRDRLNETGFFLGGPRLAVSTRAHRARGPEAYRDMAYWADPDRAVYRPQFTLEELRRSPAFEYVPRHLVHAFVETRSGVHVQTTDERTGAREEHEAQALVLAAGTFGTARIVLRSLGRWGLRVPILCNPYTYAPTVNLALLGRAVADRRHGLAQLTAMLRVPGAGGRLVQAQVHSYRSLLTFKLMKEIPLGHRVSRQALQMLMPSFAILGIHHEDRPSAGKTCRLRRGGDEPDVLEVRYQPSDDEVQTQRADERRLLGHFLRLGCLPLKVMRLGHGSNMHYAGTFPILAEGGDLTCDLDSRLRATRAVYLADGSVFPWLPAKGLTFNIMANADRVGTVLARRLAP
jgi:choline dehydrogenase-like flavoprotein